MNGVSNTQQNLDYGLTALQSQSQNVSSCPLMRSDLTVTQSSKASDSYEHSSNSHEHDLFSHNRSTAIKAYLAYGKQSDSSSSMIYNDEGSVAASNEQNSSTQDISSQPTASQENQDSDKVNDPTVKRGVDGEALDEAEAAEVKELEDRDAEVKAHERAHQSAGGQYAGAPQYEYERGPDGKDYATEGHVDVDVSEESTPEKTLEKMQRVIAAAKAPAEPSSQDLKVAAEANQKAAEARTEIASEAVGNDEEEDSSDLSEVSATSQAPSKAKDKSNEDNSSNSATFENKSGDSEALSDLLGQSLEIVKG